MKLGFRHEPLGIELAMGWTTGNWTFPLRTLLNKRLWIWWTRHCQKYNSSQELPSGSLTDSWWTLPIYDLLMKHGDFSIANSKKLPAGSPIFYTSEKRQRRYVGSMFLSDTAKVRMTCSPFLLSIHCYCKWISATVPKNTLSASFIEVQAIQHKQGQAEQNLRLEAAHTLRHPNTQLIGDLLLPLIPRGPKPARWEKPPATSRTSLWVRMTGDPREKRWLEMWPTADQDVEFMQRYRMVIMVITWQ